MDIKLLVKKMQLEIIISSQFDPYADTVNEMFSNNANIIYDYISKHEI